MYIATFIYHYHMISLKRRRQSSYKFPECLFIKRLIFSLCKILMHLFQLLLQIYLIFRYCYHYNISTYFFVSHIFIFRFQYSICRRFVFVPYLLLDASIFFHFYLFKPLFFSFSQKRYTVHFFILNFLLLSSFVCIPLHTFLVCDTIFLLYFILPLRDAPSTAIHAIFFSLSSFLFLSSYCGEDCRAISVGSDVTWKMHCPRALDRIICIRGVYAYLPWLIQAPFIHIR